MKNFSEYNVIGLMSGTSLDGVDLAFCNFICRNENKESKNWEFKILNAETVAYNKEWKNRLQHLHDTDALTFAKTHVELGKYFGNLAKKFISKNKLKPDLISSHGHTIFHQPENGFTSQIGDGSQIAAITNIETVCDFRTKDVALGGQGAPLVPIGDRLLFYEYDYCLNLGGIANISFEKNKERVAFDICPVNMALNYLAAEAKLNYDKNGSLATKGKINNELLNKLNALDYYRKHPPKSIGKEWFLKNCEPLISDTSISLNDRLRTFCEHIAISISGSLNIENNTKKKMLITGGGAHNKFLIQCISESFMRIQTMTGAMMKNISIEIPSKEIIDFKEALIFAFLGVLRIRKEINVLKSVTGAGKDSIGGNVFAGG
ncbi:MAG: anhydro-N-acetylmuramic acid kinase [Bacteroidota bacterium]